VAGILTPIPFWPKPFVVFDVAVGKGDIGAPVMTIRWKIIPRRGRERINRIAVPKPIIDAFLMLVDKDEGSCGWRADDL